MRHWVIGSLGVRVQERTRLKNGRPTDAQFGRLCFQLGIVVRRTNGGIPLHSRNSFRCTSLGRWGIAAFGMLAAQAAGAQVNFSDITAWVGSGQNQAAFVIDWASGATPQSQVWGYRWNGTATGLDMLNAIVGADNRLYREWVPGYINEAVFGYGLDRNGNGFSKLDPQDSYQEGFYTNGYWGYYVEVVPSASLPAWTFASTGPGGRVLTDGSWDGWSWAQNFNGTTPSVPTPISAPVPEPGVWALLVSASAGGVLLRRKTRQS